MRTRSALMLVCSAGLWACGGGEPATDTMTMGDTATPVTATASPLSALAGRWSVRVMNAAGDSIASYELMATADGNGTTLTFPGRPALPVTIVEASGDSIVTEIGPYESVLRPGVQTTTRSVNRVQGDQLTGTFHAMYAGAGADSMLHGTMQGTRIP